MADYQGQEARDELSREIAEYALYALKNRVERIGALPVSEQDQIRATICSAARTILEHMNDPQRADGRGVNGDD